MSDLTDRALDTASARGASYADVRSVRRLEESISIKTGRVEGVASGESEGFGVRVLVDGAWGFASSHVLTTAEADRVAAEAVRIARASATALRDQTRLDDRPPAHGRYETPLEEDPFAVPLETKIARPARRGRGGGARQGHRLHRVELCGTARMEDLRRDRRQPDRAGHHPCRGRDRGQRRRRRRAPAPELPGLGRRLGRWRLRDRPPAGSCRARRAAGRRGGRAPDGPAVPVRPVHDHPRPEPALPPGPRVVRPPDRARPGLRDRGVVRRDQLPDHRQARRGLPLRLGPHRHRRRRDRTRRHGHVRLGR